jgi:2'-5' RNA ligase
MRLFVAVWPPPDVVATLAALPRFETAGLRWSAADKWHVTLRFLGSVPDASPVIAAVGDAVAGLAPVPVRIGPAVALLGRGVVMVPVAGLDEVAGAVVRATAALGEAPDQRPFRGHITLARLRSRARLAAGAVGAPLAGGWTGGSVTVVRSHLGPDGARYERLAMLTFGGRGAGG